MSSDLSAPPAETLSLRRRDGRQPLDMRGRELKVSVSSQFDGSCFYAQGNSAVQVSIHGPTTASRKASAGEESYLRASVRVRILRASTQPTAGGAERMAQQERGAIQHAQHDVHEMLTVLEAAVESVFMSERFPRGVLCVDVMVLSEDGSLVAAAVNAVMAALLDGGVPCRTTMAAISVAALAPRAHAGAPQRPQGDGGNSAQGRKRERSLVEGSHEAAQRLVYVLDPTASEERNASVTTTPGATSSPAAATAASEASQTVNGKASEKNIDDYTSVAHGVFVFSNPSCGGGLLASHVHRSVGVGAGASAAAAAAASADADAVAERNVSAAEWMSMASLAERASHVMFSFFRQCNVPLE